MKRGTPKPPAYGKPTAPEPATLHPLRVRKRIDALLQAGSECHRAGDVYALSARAAKSRRAERHANSANARLRAVGTAAEATAWLLDLMTRGMRARHTPDEAALRTMAATLTGAEAEIEVLTYEAAIATAYHPEPSAPRPARKR